MILLSPIIHKKQIPPPSPPLIRSHGKISTPVTPPASSSRSSPHSLTPFFSKLIILTMLFIFLYQLVQILCRMIYLVFSNISSKCMQERRYLLKEFPELVLCGENSKLLEVGCGNGSTVLPVLRYLILIYATSLLNQSPAFLILSHLMYMVPVFVFWLLLCAEEARTLPCTLAIVAVRLLLGLKRTLIALLLVLQKLITSILSLVTFQRLHSQIGWRAIIVDTTNIATIQVSVPSHK